MEVEVPQLQYSQWKHLGYNFPPNGKSTNIKNCIIQTQKCGYIAYNYISCIQTSISRTIPDPACSITQINQTKPESSSVDLLQIALIYKSFCCRYYTGASRCPYLAICFTTRFWSRYTFLQKRHPNSYHHIHSACSHGVPSLWSPICRLYTIQHYSPP